MIHVGDCLDILPTLPAQSVYTCVTSPPYFGLRDYGVDGQIGLEPTPVEFVEALVRVFREVRRVLRDDGTVWLNLGDSYAGGGGGNYNKTGKTRANGCQITNVRNREDWLTAAGVKAKDLIGIPWRVAFALQADGWYLRQDIIWSKPNPMPESVRDRCTKAHEYLFLLSKSGRYYFDADAIKEPASSSSLSRWAHDVESQTGSDRVPGKTNGTMKAVGGRRSTRDSFKREGSKREQAIPGQSVGTHRPDREESEYDIEARNKRSVWTVATMPFREAHFATFPEALIEPCILAGTPAGGVVLDPFMGSGTTAAVAQRLGRQYVGCELNPDYVEIARRRVAGTNHGLPFGAAA